MLADVVFLKHIPFTPSSYSLLEDEDFDFLNYMVTSPVESPSISNMPCPTIIQHYNVILPSTRSQSSNATVIPTLSNSSPHDPISLSSNPTPCDDLSTALRKGRHF